VAAVVVTAINTAAADYVDYARVANANLLYSIPTGKYRPEHLNDGDLVVMFPPGVEPTSRPDTTIQDTQQEGSQ
jgi:type IV secretory pathway protease TraF